MNCQDELRNCPVCPQFWLTAQVIIYSHFCVFRVRLINIPNSKSLKRNFSNQAVRQQNRGQSPPLLTSPRVSAGGREVLITWADIQASVCFAAPLNPPSG